MSGFTGLRVARRDEKEALENIKEAIAWLWAEDQKAAKALGSDRTPILVAV
jgi:hypothetical protein